MQSVCLLFAGRRGLDDYNLRTSIIRVPEVSQKIKSAQLIFDHKENSIDLYSYALSSDTDYSDRPQLRVLVSEIVQIGLYERYIKFRHKPQFMIGKMNNSALKVCSGKMSFQEFVINSDFFQQLNNISNLNESTRLSGLKLEEYSSVYLKDNRYEDYNAQSKDCYSIIHEIGNDNIINQYIHIGPCIDFRKQ